MKLQTNQGNDLNTLDKLEYKIQQNFNQNLKFQDYHSWIQFQEL